MNVLSPNTIKKEILWFTISFTAQAVAIVLNQLNLEFFLIFFALLLNAKTSEQIDVALVTDAILTTLTPLTISQTN